MAKLLLTFEQLRGVSESQVNLEVAEAEFQYDSPDDAQNKASTGNMTLTVSGKIDEKNDEEMLRLINEWVRLEGQETGAYCKVTLNVIGTNERYHRQFVFPEAFVVDYTETYSTSGLSYEFNVRQRQDKLNNITFDGGFRDGE